MNKKVKFVIVGFGNMGKDWVPVLQKNKMVEIVGVVDVIDKNLEQAKEMLSLSSEHVGKDLKNIIKITKPDAILDTSPPFNHKSVTTIAMDMGCHVLGEKPISLDIKEAKEIVKLCKQKKKIYAVNQNYRWNPMVQEIKKIILSNKLGNIYSIDINYSQNFNFTDTFRYKIDHPMLLDMAIHHFDLVRSFTNTSFKQVYCVEYNAPESKFKNGSSAVATFTMVNGIIFNYSGSWSDVAGHNSFMGIWKIVGNKGVLLWDGNSNPKIESLKGKKIITTEVKLSRNKKMNDKDMFAYELNNTLQRFLFGVEHNAMPETWCGDNIHTLEMVLGAIESSKQGKNISRSTI